jgi:DNA-binding NarL/FixJ family response regulator
MKISVFLADDHAIIRDGLKLLLEEQQDIRVVGEAGNGRDAVIKIQQQCPDIAIIDIAMPELNGIEAARLIRDSCPSLKVLILSMLSSAELIHRSFQAGAKGYLLKESAGFEVVKAVRLVHEGKYYLSQKISDDSVTDYLKVLNGKNGGPISRLGRREREILQYVVEGKSSAEIAKILALSQKTVETYRSRIHSKLEINDLPSLIKFAIQNGVTPP